MLSEEHMFMLELLFVLFEGVEIMQYRNKNYAL
jgi:hypothetical protein